MCKIRRLLNRFGKSIKKTVAEKAVLTDKRTMRKSMLQNRFANL